LAIAAELSAGECAIHDKRSKVEGVEGRRMENPSGARLYTRNRFPEEFGPAPARKRHDSAFGAVCGQRRSAGNAKDIASH
jgi:hypothetical protein